MKKAEWTYERELFGSLNILEQKLCLGIAPCFDIGKSEELRKHQHAALRLLDGQLPLRVLHGHYKGHGSETLNCPGGTSVDLHGTQNF